MARADSNRSSFPITPTDGQVFVDSEFVRWVYNADLDLWERSGTVESIQLADDDNDGLMSASHKRMLDKIPDATGGFGIIVDPKLLLSDAGNPDGVISGDIELRSDSIDIECLGYDDNTNKCATAVDVAGNMASITFSPSEKFLSTFCVKIPSVDGDRGDKGDRGDQGDHGFSKGPQGIKGKKGDDIGERYKLVGVELVDSSELTDTAIVDLKMSRDNGSGCKMVVTKGKLDIAADQPVDKIAVTPLYRSVSYDSVTGCNTSRIDDWRLAKPRNDTTELDLKLLRLQKSDDAGDGVQFDGSMPLSKFVSDIVEEYKKRLIKIDQEWGKQVKEYIENIDDKARSILSDLAHQLAMCEFNLPAMEFCITFPCRPTSPSQAASSSASAVHEYSGGHASSASMFNIGGKLWKASI